MARKETGSAVNASKSLVDSAPANPQEPKLQKKKQRRAVREWLDGLGRQDAGIEERFFGSPACPGYRRHAQEDRHG
jgi:hypothetical protein